MDSPIEEKKFTGRPTIEHGKRVLVAMAVAGFAALLALLTVIENSAATFAVSCFGVSTPISVILAMKIEVDDPRDWYKGMLLPQVLYLFNGIAFVIGVAAIFALFSSFSLFAFIVGVVIAGVIYQR